MWSFSSADWNHATLVVGGYGIGLILLSAVTLGLLLAKGSRGRMLYDSRHESFAVMSVPFASWPRRFIALSIDVAMLVTVSALPALAVHPVVGAIVLCVSASVYFPLGYGAGYTLGTVLTRIRIVNRRGMEPGLSCGALRYLMFFATMFPRGGRTQKIRIASGIPFDPVTMQGGHDRFAGTYVVRISDEVSPRGAK